MKAAYKNWFVHNVIAHPMMQILNMIGMKKAADFVHDKTLPEDGHD